jgi:hypothetical protein
MFDRLNLATSAQSDRIHNEVLQIKFIHARQRDKVLDPNPRNSVVRDMLSSVVSLDPSIPYIRVRVPVGSRPGSKFRVL